MSSTSSEHNVNVRILAPTNDNIEKIIQDVVIAAGEDQEAGKKQAENFTIQRMNPPTSETAVSTVTIVVADKKDNNTTITVCKNRRIRIG